MPGAPDRLTDIQDFGSNPGSLRGHVYIPDALGEGAPLVVVLHGCTQTASGYDAASGWSRLADRNGFALLFPEQSRQNNPNLCFNWFAPGDIRRGAGEVHSIAQMIETMVATHNLDPRRVFITGLSAGGAMAAAMLATYPEKFAAGAIIAGLPYGCATTVPQALDRMRGHGLPSTRDLRAAVGAASSHTGPWPRISIWHGSADRTVDAANADAIAAQWGGVLNVGEGKAEMIGRHHRQVWHDADGREVLESIRIAGMGHGAPLDPRLDSSNPSPFMLDVGISSTLEIARFWGIAEPVERAAASPADKPRTSAAPARQPTPSQAAKPANDHITRTIEDALRAAGLMR